MHFCSDTNRHVLGTLLGRYNLTLIDVPDGESIPGSYWGAPEAGLVGTRVYARLDTPLHSVLHEACHVICMDGARRGQLHTDAGGDYHEENAVCFLQLILADGLQGIGREALAVDMDEWGYTFRLGSARSWFEQDAEDARRWLLREGLITEHGTPTWQLRR
jgi:hypothetical protein